MIKRLLFAMQDLIDSAELNQPNSKVYHVSKVLLDRVSSRLDGIKSINPTKTIPHCPYCFEQMSFTEPSINESNESIKQHLTCNSCDIMVYIHQFI